MLAGRKWFYKIMAWLSVVVFAIAFIHFVVKPLPIEGFFFDGDWLMFAAGLGESEAAVRAQALNPETEALIDTLGTLSRRSFASGLGALYAYEAQFPPVATAKIAGLVEHFGIDDEQTLRFFKVHESADLEHSAVCRDLLDGLPEEEREEAILAGEAIAAALWNFLSGVEASQRLN